MQDQLIKKIKGGIIGIKNGTKEPKEIAPLLNRLKAVNEGMYEDLLKEYKQALENRKKN
ncbi:MAG: hypothetical protein KatS3mg035_1050 [Bacteroidia bacterium]|nr:MAG: hypothetical protein KatS3mg035_1050 [Bacteroidia bacterium]